MHAVYSLEYAPYRLAREERQKRGNRTKSRATNARDYDPTHSAEEDSSDGEERTRSHRAKKVRPGDSRP
jgi:hypothetical protein